MRVSRAAVNSLNGLFLYSANRQCTNTRLINMDLNYLNHNVFGLFLRISYTKSHVVVPLFYRSHVERIITDNSRESESFVSETNIALYTNDSPYTVKTLNGIVKLLYETDFNRKLRKVVTNKGEIYYVGYGIIFDKNFNPIFFCALEGDYVENGFKYKAAKIYINPSVFLSDETLEKGIIKTIIPVYMSNGVSIYINNAFFEADFKKIDNKVIPEIVVKDFTDDFFVKPARPKPSSFTIDNVNDFLLNHIDDIKAIAHL